MDACPGFPASGGQQFGQPREIVGGHGQDEAGAHPFDTPIEGLGHATDGLGPSKGEEDQKTIRGDRFPAERQALPLSGSPAAQGAPWRLIWTLTITLAG